MAEPVGKRGRPRKVVWFDVGAGLLFITIGLSLVGRGLWHAVLHHELLPKTFVSSALFCAVGVMFVVQGLKSKRPSRGRPRGKVSKRHRRIPFFVLLLVLVVVEPSAISSPGRNAFVLHLPSFAFLCSCACQCRRASRAGCITEAGRLLACEVRRRVADRLL